MAAVLVQLEGQGGHPGVSRRAALLLQPGPGRHRPDPCNNAARGPSRPGGARSSAARDRPLLWVGWPPYAGPRRPPRRARLRAVGKKGTATAGAAERERVGAALVIGGGPPPPRGGPPPPPPRPPRGGAGGGGG